MMPPRRRTSLAQAVVTWAGGRLISLLLLAAVGWGLVTMYQGPRWRVEWVEVAGCNLVSPERVVQASDLADAWIVALEPGAVAAKVEEVPGIVDASVAVGWPSRVRIVVEEDQPLATVRLGDQEYWVSRHQGLVMPYGVTEGLPVLRIVDAEPGATTVPDRVIEGLRAMQSSFPDQAEYLYDSTRGFEIQSDRGYPVYLGDAGELDLKLQMLAALEDDLQAQGHTPAFVDLSSVEGAYYQ